MFFERYVFGLKHKHFSNLWVIDPETLPDPDFVLGKFIVSLRGNPPNYEEMSGGGVDGNAGMFLGNMPALRVVS